MQKNLSDLVRSTDAELAAWPDPWPEMTGSVPLDAEGRREEARSMQDRLDRQGRDAFAAEHAERQRLNLGGAE